MEDATVEARYIKLQESVEILIISRTDTTLSFNLELRNYSKLLEFDLSTGNILRFMTQMRNFMIEEEYPEK
jgi:hypothetical protein